MNNSIFSFQHLGHFLLYLLLTEHSARNINESWVLKYRLYGSRLGGSAM